MFRFPKSAKTLLVLSLAGAVLGCETKAGTGALAGGAGGALVGGLIGSASHARAGEGALIGAAAGAIGGALIGHAMDESDKKKEREAENRTYTDRDYTTNSAYSASSTAVTPDDVIAWTQRGTREDIIIDRIERSNTVYHLTAADENRLRDAGVSETVIIVMRDTARR